MSGNILRTVWNATSPADNCQVVLTVRVSPRDSGINLPVPDYGTAEDLPYDLKETATSGVLLTVFPLDEKMGNDFGPWIEWVRFDGRVLYPSSMASYTTLAG